jgi:glucosamine--fructose-6-phosphate aminotransferase (isomerizing)
MTPPSPRRTAMREEIEAIPGVVERFLVDGRAEVAAAAEAVRRSAPAFVTIVARGTSDHAALHLRYLIETELGIPTGLAAPSITTIYGATIRWRGGLVIAVSQSGRSPDLIAVLEAARADGATTIAIANDAASPLAEAAEHIIDCRAGEERAVAATKSYVAQLAAGAALVAAVGGGDRLTRGLAELPSTLAAAFGAAVAGVHDGSEIVEAFAASERSIVISRGYDYATALETALKLKETGRLFAEGYSSADFSHGPKVLIDAAVPVLAIRPEGPMGDAVDEGITAARDAGGRPWVVAGEGTTAGESGRWIALPLPRDLHPGLAPLATILPGQLLAEAVARRRGYDPDAPPGLRKVTLTR